MSKAKNEYPASDKPSLRLWQKIVAFFKGKRKSSQEPILEPEVSALKDVSIEELTLEEISQELDLDNQKTGEVEIAFLNPDTGELEVLTLSQSQASQSTHNDAQETLLVLELDPRAQLPKQEKLDEKDLYDKITHFPPSGRLH